MLIQQEPIIVEVLKQPAATPDISVEVVLGMFELAGAALLVAALGGIVAGAIFIGVRRRRDASAPPTDTGHVRLRI